MYCIHLPASPPGDAWVLFAEIQLIKYFTTDLKKGWEMASGSVKVIIAALIGNTLIAVTKISAAFNTGSSASTS
jgi:aspartokinase-like uncharacterized kinase